MPSAPAFGTGLPGIQQIPPRVEYSLTEFGRSLEPVLLLMHDWGSEYVDRITERRMAIQAQSADEAS